MAGDGNKAAKNAIKSYLDRRAKKDSQFAQLYANPGKNIDDCMRYIIGEARKRGSEVCMTDDEVFGLAVHYYDEQDITIAKVAGSVVVSNTGGAQQPKAEKKKVKTEKERGYSPSLFDFDEI